MYNLDQTGFAQMSKGMKNKGNNITEQTRYSFWLAFGIIPELQIQLENSYSTNNIIVEEILAAAGIPHHEIIPIPIFQCPQNEQQNDLQ